MRLTLWQSFWISVIFLSYFCHIGILLEHSTVEVDGMKKKPVMREADIGAAELNKLSLVIEL